MGDCPMSCAYRKPRGTLLSPSPPCISETCECHAERVIGPATFLYDLAIFPNCFMKFSNLQLDYTSYYGWRVRIREVFSARCVQRAHNKKDPLYGSIFAGRSLRDSDAAAHSWPNRH